MREITARLVDMMSDGEDIDALVRRARSGSGDRVALAKAIKRIIGQLESREAEAIEPASLRDIYVEVEKGVTACAQVAFLKSCHFVASKDAREKLLAIVEIAVADWLVDAAKQRPVWNPRHGSLTQFVESHSQKQVMNAIAHVSRRGAWSTEPHA